jgi:uncharacterized damage-inducible protein DinB
MSRRELLINSLQATVHDLIRNLRTIDEAAARCTPTPDGWSIADVVAHLGYIEPLYLARLRRIAKHDNPFEPYLGPDRSAHDLSRPLNELLQQFILRRAETVVFLQGLEQADWARRVTHETMGPGRLRDHVQMLVEHDSDHLQQIVTLREKLERSA